MKRILTASTLLVLCMNVSLPAQAQDQDLVSFSLGYHDVLDDQEAVNLRAEYRFKKTLLLGHIKPWTGLEITSDASGWLGGGILADFKITDNLYFTPNLGVGLYAQGSSDKDLGHTIEFRTQLELNYELENKSRIGLAVSHTSNAGLDNDQNPGTEVLSVYYHIPAERIF